MRSFREMTGGGAGPDALGSPGLIPGVRATPNVYEPVPNAEPAGANTGAPPRTRLYSRLVAPASTRKPTLIVAGTPENRIAIITSPAIGFTVFVGDSAGVTPLDGLPLPPGLNYEIPLPGLQDLYAVTNSPAYVRVGVLVSIVLAAERQRPTSGI